MTRDLPPARPRGALPGAHGYPIAELPRGRRAAGWRAGLRVSAVILAAAGLWGLIGLAVWRLFQ